jgi:hypothetical protein
MRRFNQRTAFASTGICLALCIVVSPALAQQETFAPEASIELGVGHTDNVNRDADELDSDIGRLSVGFAVRSDRRWLQTAVAGDLEYLKYSADEVSVDDEVLGSVDGTLVVLIVPDRVQWDFGLNYGQARVDALGPVGPLNRQAVTSFSTGPQITIPLAERTSLQASGLISEQSFEERTDLDGRRTAARLGLERQIDPVTRLTFAFDVSETEYDLDSLAYEYETLSLEYRRELATGEAIASIGRGSVEIGGNSEPTTVAQLLWKRAVGARSKIEICVGREITDAGDAFAGAGVAAGCPGDIGGMSSASRTTRSREQGTISTTSPFVRGGGSVTFLWDNEVANFRATFSLSQDRFEEISTFDNDSTAVELSGSREFARHWRAAVGARLWVQDFNEVGEKNEDQSVSLSVSRRLSGNMRLSLSFEQIRRDGGVDPFDSNEYFLSLGRDFGR